jgi:hypothetical protein
VVVEVLYFSKKGAILLVGDYPIRQLVLYEKDFGWMVFRELNPEVLGSLWLMASATWGGGIILAESLNDWGRRAVSLLNFTLKFALQLRKSTENLSHDYSLRRLGRRLGLGWPAEHQYTSVPRR